MERNPNFTKERADFVFDKIKRYYEQNAYKLVIDEYESNKELIGSVLNIGSQLKLNKFVSTSILNLLIDAFEVDGNLALFDALWNKYHTNIEIHSSKEKYELINKYHSEREKNPKFKSKKEHLNKDIPVDDSCFDDVIKFSVKTSGKKTKSAELIEQDFLDSIEKPTYMFSLVDDIEQNYGKITRSNVDNDAIKEDFLNLIKKPTQSSISKRENVEEVFEQLTFEHSTEQKDTSSNKKKNNKSQNRKLPSDKVEPISIDDTILGKKEDDAIKRLRNKIDKIENKPDKTAPTENKPHEEVLAQRSFVKDGKKGTHTIYKSGARVTEITIETGAKDESDDLVAVDAAIEKQRSVNRKIRDKRGVAKQNQNVAQNQNENKAEISMGTGSSKKSSHSKKGNSKTDKKSKSNFEFKYVAIILLLAVIITGGYYYRDNIYNIYVKLSSSFNTANIQGEPNNSGNSIYNENNDSSNSSDSDTTNTDNTTNLNNEEDPLDTPQEPEAKYILPSNEREITQADMANMTKSELRYALNEMFARHGWHFGQTGDFYNYFMEQSWYKPDLTLQNPLDAEKKMSELEINNLLIIKAKYDSTR